MMDSVRFAQAYSFKYSPRPGTPAAGLDQLPEEIKVARLSRLHDVISQHQTSFNLTHVGKAMPVLFERRGRRPGQLIGRSPYLQSVHAQLDSAWIGKILEVEITAGGPNSLAGIVRAASAA
jgi:tRNA-2-methylthio-N6-dimethylallyladenosine synthase